MQKSFSELVCAKCVMPWLLVKIVSGAILIIAYLGILVPAIAYCTLGLWGIFSVAFIYWILFMYICYALNNDYHKIIKCGIGE